jgi:carbonic anhydrase
MERLLAGYRRFRQDRWPERRQLFEALADAGQEPRALVISCADSRVDPGMIFDAGPGELFTVRNVAAIVPPYAPDGRYHGTSAAVEYAVRVLQVPDILVMGHALCGGVRALLDDSRTDPTDFIAHWIQIAEPARARTMARDDIPDRQLCCEQETVRLSLDNLLTFPWIADRLAAGALRLQGAHFDIRSGELSLLQGDGGFSIYT